MILSVHKQPTPMILQFRLRAYNYTSATWVVGVYDTLGSARRAKASWESISKFARYVVEPNP
jgi:hypothetical protein